MSKKDLDSTSSSATGSAKALVKGLSLVELVAESDRPLRLVDLVGASGLPRPTALRLLEALCQTEVLRLDAGGSYDLGPRVAAWGQSFLDRLDLRSQSVELMEQLVEISGETCFLGVLDRGHVLYVAVVNSPHPIRPAARPGSRNPLHCTGIGKALLSGLNDEQVHDLITVPLERRTPNTETDPVALLEQLQLIRQRGYSIDEVENEEGVRCVAVPIRDHTGAAVAGLSVSAPAYRFSTEDVHRLAPDVVRVAEELSRRLGAPARRQDVELEHNPMRERSQQ